MGQADTALGAEWKRKRVQQLKKKIRGVLRLLRNCEEQSDDYSESYQKAHSQRANFQTQLDALQTWGGTIACVVPVRPADTVIVNPVGQHPAPREDPRTPLYQLPRDISSDGPPTLLEGTPTGPPPSLEP